MPRPVHFELTVADPERAADFYKRVFGWSFEKWDGPMPYWLVTTGPDGEPGINGGLMLRQGEMGPGTTNTTAVPSVDASIDTIKSAGGQIIMGKTAIRGMGWVAYALDSEGNQFGVFEEDASAV